MGNMGINMGNILKSRYYLLQAMHVVLQHSVYRPLYLMKEVNWSTDSTVTDKLGLGLFSLKAQ